MAFPNTNMAGYADLKRRIDLALSRCQEQAWLDFKESQPWPELRWRLLKTCMAMANLRDGGLIVIGVAERDTTWELTGIQQEHLETYDYDDVIDQLSKYASPQIKTDIVLHEDEERHQFLAFHTYQFSDAPIVCRKNSPDSVKSKDRLAAGEVYTRPASGKPQTAKVTDAERLHDLLELAAEFRARRMLEAGKRVGLLPSETSTSKFNSELGRIKEIPVPVKSFPYWTVRFRPELYSPDLIPSLTECIRLVEKNRVSLRGWDFPHLSNNAQEKTTGSSWVGSWANFMGSVEYWQLFQSGQFIHFSALREATESNFKQHLQTHAMEQLKLLGSSDWNTVPGFLSLVNQVYTITEYFEFAARICQAGIYEGQLHITLELKGVKGYLLTTELNRMWRQYCRANEDDFIKTWTISTDKLVADSCEESRKAIVWLFESFGWMSPNIEAINKEQRKLLSGQA